MGCWNETCVLTRTPIRYADPVVALATVSGPRYREPAGGSFKTALLFGLPYKGVYDDYGGVEKQEHPHLAEFAERAFVAAGLYRQHTFKRSYGTLATRWIASSESVFWGLERQMQHLFYDECGVSPADVGSYENGATERTTAAYKRAEAALKALGAELSTIVLPEEEAAQETALHELVSRCFGASRAWSALDFLRSNGLFAWRQHLLMHRAAYDAAVADFGGRSVRRRAAAQTVRDFCASELDTWSRTYEEELARLSTMFGQLDLVADEAMRKRTKRLVSGLAPKSPYLQPMTSPWQTPETPMTGHFWGGATVKEVLDAYDRNDIVDYLVFQWARHALRIELTRPTSGSQSRETRLSKALQDAVYAQLEIRADHDLSIHD